MKNKIIAKTLMLFIIFFVALFINGCISSTTEIEQKLLSNDERLQQIENKLSDQEEKQNSIKTRLDLVEANQLSIENINNLLGNDIIFIGNNTNSNYTTGCPSKEDVEKWTDRYAESEISLSQLNKILKLYNDCSG